MPAVAEPPERGTIGLSVLRLGVRSARGANWGTNTYGLGKCSSTRGGSDMLRHGRPPADNAKALDRHTSQNVGTWNAHERAHSVYQSLISESFCHWCSWSAQVKRLCSARSRLPLNCPIPTVSLLLTTNMPVRPPQFPCGTPSKPSLDARRHGPNERQRQSQIDSLMVQTHNIRPTSHLQHAPVGT